MVVEKIKSGQWVIIEGDTQSHSLFKLINGRTGIYKDGEKIASLEVKKGEKPIMLGFIAVLSKARKNTASVKTETDVKVELVNANHLRGLLQYDTPKNLEKDIDIMIDTIDICNQMRSLKSKLSKTPAVNLKIPKNINRDVLEVLEELSNLYGDMVNGSVKPKAK